MSYTTSYRVPVYFLLIPAVKINGSVAKRKGCLSQKRHKAISLFFLCNCFIFGLQKHIRGRYDEGRLGGLDNVFELRYRHHCIRSQILCQIVGLTFILAES